MSRRVFRAFVCVLMSCAGQAGLTTVVHAAARAVKPKAVPASPEKKEAVNTGGTDDRDASGPTASRAGGMPKSDGLPALAVTLGLVPLAQSPRVVELMGEFTLTRRLSLALAGGTAVGTSLEAYGVSGQFRLYVLGTPRQGLDVGLQAGYGWTGATLGPLTPFRAGVSAGMFVGYKFVAPVGLTVDLQAGVQGLYRSVGVEVVGFEGARLEYETQIEPSPILRANLGWSM